MTWITIVWWGLHVLFGATALFGVAALVRNQVMLWRYNQHAPQSQKQRPDEVLLTFLTLATVGLIALLCTNAWTWLLLLAAIATVICGLGAWYQHAERLRQV